MAGQRIRHSPATWERAILNYKYNYWVRGNPHAIRGGIIPPCARPRTTYLGSTVPRPTTRAVYPLLSIYFDDKKLVYVLIFVRRVSWFELRSYRGGGCIFCSILIDPNAHTAGKTWGREVEGNEDKDDMVARRYNLVPDCRETGAGAAHHGAPELYYLPTSAAVRSTDQQEYIDTPEYQTHINYHQCVYEKDASAKATEAINDETAYLTTSNADVRAATNEHHKNTRLP
ncbi:hypothetical protein CBL_03826 [Carabus blaptoides fortunei]